MLTEKHITTALEKLKQPQPIVYSSVCFECLKGFHSYKQINNFLKCEEHKKDKEVYGTDYDIEYKSPVY